MSFARNLKTYQRTERCNGFIEDVLLNVFVVVFGDGYGNCAFDQMPSHQTTPNADVPKQVVLCLGSFQTQSRH